MSGNVNVITISDVDFKRIMASAVEEGIERALSKVENYSDDEYLTIEEAAELVGVTPTTINNWRISKSLKNCVKRGHRYYYSKKEITRGKL